MLDLSYWLPLRVCRLVNASAACKQQAVSKQVSDTIALHFLSLVQELARRCDTLIRLVEKENEEVEAAEQAEKKKSSKKTSGSRATDSSGGGAGTSTKVRPLLVAQSGCFVSKTPHTWASAMHLHSDSRPEVENCITSTFWGRPLHGQHVSRFHTFVLSCLPQAAACLAALICCHLHCVIQHTMQYLFEGHSEHSNPETAQDG